MKNNVEVKKDLNDIAALKKKISRLHILKEKCCKAVLK